MAVIYQAPLVPLLPAHSPELAVKRAVNLPWGGPFPISGQATSGGGGYGSGLVLARIGGAAVSQVDTLTITANSSTGGTGWWVYNADQNYSGQFVSGGTTANAVTTWPTASQMQAALWAAVPQWAGNVTITGSESANYTLTYNNQCANQRIGGNLSFVFNAYTAGTGPTAALTYATKGSCGTGQFDVYSSGVNNNVGAFLGRYYKLDPVGGLVMEFGSTGAARAPWAYTSGYFRPSDLIGLDANALTLGNVGWEYGVTGDLSNPGAIVQLISA